MRITILSPVAGAYFGYRPGQTVEHPDEEEARRWIARGIAKPAEVEPALKREEEALDKPAPEVAVLRRRRRRVEPPR